MDIASLLNYGFIQRAIITGIFTALLCSSLGLFLLLRRLSLIGDGLSHVSFGAIALGLFAGVYPLYIALPTVIIASLFILKLTQKSRVYGDSAIGIVSSISVAIGVILASLSGGFTIDLFSFLFGNILTIRTGEMIATIIVSSLVLIVILLFYWDFFAISFNQELAQVTGIKTHKINSLLVILTAVTVVLSVKVVGVMLVSSLLILPAASALQIAKSFKNALFFALFSSVVCLLLGVFVSLVFNIPTGATIVLVNFLFFMLVLGYNKLRS